MTEDWRFLFGYTSIIVNGVILLMTEDWRFLFGYTSIIVNAVILFMILFNLLVYKLQQLQEAEFVKTNKRFKSLSTRKLCYRFSVQEIQRATSNFDEDLVIGEGGFGKVYKGIFNPGPTVVAIKRLQSMSKQGSVEFRTEIEMLSKFRHSHLVSLIGYCDDGYEMILVYEFMPVGTLADHLHKRVRQGDTSMLPLSWIQRLKICIGAARGLDYLHTGTSTQHRVIHRDVKTTNILLDENLAAKIGDFGLSKITPTNQASVFVSSHVKGTFGYMDPYYFLTHRITMKSDVYAFGVVLFEVLSGRPAVDLSLDEEQRGLAGWAKRCFKEGLLNQIIDPRIKGSAFHGSLDEFVRIALQCLEDGPKDRPTMGEVVVCLESALAVQEQSMPSTSADGLNVNLNQERMELSLENFMQKQRSKNYGAADKGGYLDDRLLRTSSKVTKVNTVRALTLRLFTGLQKRTNENKRINDNKRSDDLLKKVEDVAQRESPKLRVFTLDELRRSTRFFETSMMLGGREYGRVYKGWVQGKTYTPSRYDVGKTIAVKRLGPKRSLEHSKWESEIKLLQEYKHPNLVKILGYCKEDGECFIVYEYMKSGSLDTLLFDGVQPLSWAVRLKISISAARCLAYFHTLEKPVIHGNIQASNILLDGEFNAKVSGCGLAEFCLVNNDICAPFDFRGSYSSVAPECVLLGDMSLKSDVYGFGVLLLELLTGMRACNEKQESLIDWAKSFIVDTRKVKRILDPSLKPDFKNMAMLSVVSSLILQCIRNNPKKRPSMITVLETLEKINIMREYNLYDKSV